MRRVLIAVLLLVSPLVALAEEPSASPSEALATCLTDSTTGRERKDLARWVFFAMAAHPEMKPYVAETAKAAIADTDKAVAVTFTRLLTESCNTQARAAFTEGGSKAFELAFSTLGQMAMQELMSDPAVSASMGGLQKNIDEEKIGKALTGK